MYDLVKQCWRAAGAAPQDPRLSANAQRPTQRNLVKWWGGAPAWAWAGPSALVYHNAEPRPHLFMSYVFGTFNINTFADT